MQPLHPHPGVSSRRALASRRPVPGMPSRLSNPVPASCCRYAAKRLVVCPSPVGHIPVPPAMCWLTAGLVDAQAALDASPPRVLPAWCGRPGAS